MNRRFQPGWLLQAPAIGSSFLCIFGEQHYQPGENFTAHLNLEKVHLFDAETEEAINLHRL